MFDQFLILKILFFNNFMSNLINYKIFKIAYHHLI